MGSNEGADDVLRLMGLENGTTSPFDGGRALCSDTNIGEERNSLIKPEDKRSTVKGSRNNKARLMDLGNVIAALLGERIRNFLVKPPVLVERGRKL